MRAQRRRRPLAAKRERCNRRPPLLRLRTGHAGGGESHDGRRGVLRGERVCEGVDGARGQLAHRVRVRFILVGARVAGRLAREGEERPEERLDEARFKKRFGLGAREGSNERQRRAPRLAIDVLVGEAGDAQLDNRRDGGGERRAARLSRVVQQLEQRHQRRGVADRQRRAAAGEQPREEVRRRGALGGRLRPR